MSNVLGLPPPRSAPLALRDNVHAQLRKTYPDIDAALFDRDMEAWDAARTACLAQGSSLTSVGAWLQYVRTPAVDPAMEPSLHLLLRSFPVTSVCLCGNDLPRQTCFFLGPLASALHSSRPRTRWMSSAHVSCSPLPRTMQTLDTSSRALTATLCGALRARFKPRRAACGTLSSLWAAHSQRKTRHLSCAPLLFLCCGI